MVRILLIVATDTASKFQMSYPALGPAYLVGYLHKTFGTKVECRIVVDSIERHMDEFKPDIVGISSVTMDYTLAMKYAKLVKKHSLPVIIGGYHISYMPDSLTEDMDVGVIGEGEQTLAELVGLFIKHKKFDKSELKDVDGIVYWAGKKIIQTKRRELIKPIDRIPMPARELLQIGGDAAIFTSRGCPYNCVFCSSTRFWKETRFFSADYVFNEIKYIIDTYHVHHIRFYDDLFVADRKRIVEIVRLLEESGYLGKVTFSCHARANLIDDGLCMLLKKMGMKSIGIGFESGCENTLKYLKGESVTVEDNKKAIGLIKKSGMVIYGSFIIGAPQETRKDILTTLDFIKHSKLDGFDINILTPLPGTPVWDYAKSRGLVSDDMDWNKLNSLADDFDNSIILSERLSKEELKVLFKLFHKERSHMAVLSLIREGMKNPLGIPRYLANALQEAIDYPR